MLTTYTKTNRDTTPKILSIMADTQGHTTYGHLLREGFKNSDYKVDFHWYTEGQKIDPKLYRKLLGYSLPIQWIRKRNLDFQHFRVKVANSSMTRQLAVQKLKQQEYSALHIHTYMLAFLSVDLMKKLPTVVSLDLNSYQVSQLTEPSFRWTHYPNLYQGKRVFKAAARVVTFSEWARKSVIEDYKVDEGKVKAVYPGVDLKVLTLLKNLTIERQKRFNLLFIGGDFQRKGGHDILEVFLKTFSDKAELHLVTNAPTECEHPHVHIHRNVNAYTSEWVKLYQQADVFVMPTHFEAFGWVFIEAMAANLPVIATRINAIPEIVSHGETGFLIEPGDRHQLACRIRELMESPNLGREMGNKGRQVVERKFNAQTHCQILESIFKEVALFK